jgi:hypothetical protein
VVVNASAGEGSFQFSVRGYTVSGYLFNATIQPNGTVTMAMIISGEIDTPFGYAPVSGSGVWEGVSNGTGLNGTVQNVTGVIYGCHNSQCGNINYIAAGQWTGTLNGSNGAGTFSGTITFTASPFHSIPLNTPQPITGTWNAQFLLLSTS